MAEWLSSLLAEQEVQPTNLSEHSKIQILPWKNVKACGGIGFLLCIEKVNI